jgi:predicted MFS family arabinose efflux permease
MASVRVSANLASMESHATTEASETARTEPKLAPLVLATMASQALLVTLSPTTVAVGRDLGASVGVVGQARSVAAGVAVVASLAILRRIDALGVPRLLGFGAALAIVACAGVSLAPTLALFLAAHVLVGLAFALLLSAGFAGVATFPPARRPWAVGYVAGANAAAWIVVLPVVGSVTEWQSWRAAEVVPAAIALAALLSAPGAAFAPNQPAAPELSTLVHARSARRWLGAEVIAYGAWTALLTFVGAFFIERLGVPEAAAGWLLAMGATAHLTASTHSRILVNLASRRRLAAGSAVIMAILLFVLLRLATSAPLAVAIFCLVGFAAGVRSPTSSALGLEQLPRHPGAMMAARTPATQLGYLLGAVVGGAVISHGGYGTLGIVLAIGMAASAVLILRVDERPQASPPTRRRRCDACASVAELRSFRASGCTKERRRRP